MALTEKGYKNRLIDDKLNEYLETFGAVSIEGAKWCGKTWTSLNHSESASFVTEKSVRDLATADPEYIFSEKNPQLIDEWQLVPSIWDAVRHKCDRSQKKGNFILTGSTTLKDDNEVFHSGAGRIARLKMYPMSLYESGDSTGDVSISDMLANKVKCKFIRDVELSQIAHLIIRGGWPANIGDNIKNPRLVPKSYIDSILNKDINDGETKRNKDKMLMLLKSLSRNETAIVGNNTIVADIEEYENGDELLTSRQTVSEYLDVLDSLYLIDNQEAYSLNYRSSKRVGKSPKRHLVDPSLACACLDLTEEKLLNDFNTFGLMFESLVERDLRIYMDYLDGHLYHFRDNSSGEEVDAILEFSDGEYAAVEIKLTYNSVDTAIKGLKKFYDNVEKKPKFMCVIVGMYQAVVQDRETGIYIIPITSLKP